MNRSARAPAARMTSAAPVPPSAMTSRAVANAAGSPGARCGRRRRRVRPCSPHRWPPRAPRGRGSRRSPRCPGNSDAVGREHASRAGPDKGGAIGRPEVAGHHHELTATDPHRPGEAAQVDAGLRGVVPEVAGQHDPLRYPHSREGGAHQHGVLPRRRVAVQADHRPPARGVQCGGERRTDRGHGASGNGGGQPRHLGRRAAGNRPNPAGTPILSKVDISIGGADGLPHNVMPVRVGQVVTKHLHDLRHSLAVSTLPRRNAPSPGPHHQPPNRAATGPPTSP